jgi:predicted nucleic acid-binding protein
LKYARTVLGSFQGRLTTISASDELVMLAATLKARHPISYADGFATATAILHSVPLITGDPEIRTMAAREKTLQLHWVGN